MFYREFVLGSIEQTFVERKEALKTKALEEKQRRILSSDHLNRERSPRASFAS